MNDSNTAVIFDFNGVIINDEDLHFILFQKLLKDFDIYLSRDEYWTRYLAYDDLALIQNIFKDNQKQISKPKANELIKTKNREYLEMVQKGVPLFEGVVELIQNLAQQIKLAIVSGALRSEIEQTLHQNNLTHYFEFIIAADDVKNSKPHPEGYLMAKAKLKKQNPNLNLENFWVIEDSPGGITAAKKAGMQVIGITNSYSAQYLKDADFIVNNFEQTSALFKKLNLL